MTITLIASEGGSGHYPENTAYAVQESLRAGVDGCELDFHLTTDNVFVAHHDYLLNRHLTRDPNGNWLKKPGPAINQMTYTDLQRYDVGTLNPESKTALRYPNRAAQPHESIPAFRNIEEAYLHHSAPSCELWFEAKTDPLDPVNTTPAEKYVEELAKLLPESPLFTRTVLIAFDWQLLELAQIAMPGIQTGFLTLDFAWLKRSTSAPGELSKWFGNYNPENFSGSIPQAVVAAGGSYWSPYFRDLDLAAVQEAHDLGIKVSTWGADEAEDISQALATGVDSLTTGYVDRARRIAEHAAG